MKNNTLALLFTGTIQFCSFITQAQPLYKSEGTKEIISKMVAAHGGMTKWNAAPSLSFKHILVFGEPLGTEFWLSEETTEIKTERTYQDWPMFNGQLASNGEKIWTENWALDNPPGVNVNNIYQAMAMPWLTQKNDVTLEEQPKSKLYNDSIQYYVVKMTFSSTSKESQHKYYKLFIHPVSYLITGIEFNITYAPFLDLIGLPKDVKSFGPFTHVIYAYAKIDNLIFPEKYDSFDGQGNNSGRHVAYDYSIKNKFDAKRMSISKTAEIDKFKSDR